MEKSESRIGVKIYENKRFLACHMFDRTDCK